MTDIAPHVAELRELLAKIREPEPDVNYKPGGLEHGLTVAELNALSDWKYRVASAQQEIIRALPTLLDALTNSAGSEEGDTKESYWLDEVLRRNGPCPTCGAIGMLGTVEDKLATPNGSGTDEEVERVGRALAGRLSDFGITLEPSVLRSAARAALSARSGEVALEQKPVVHHLGVALQNVADYHADVLNPREIKALYAAAALLWDDPRAALKEAGR